MAFDPATEEGAQKQQTPADEDEPGGAKGASHQGKEIVAGQAAQKDGQHVSPERIPAGGAEYPEEVKGDGGHKGGQENTDKGGFEEVVDRDLIDVAFPNFPELPGLKGKGNEPVVEKAGDEGGYGGDNGDQGGRIELAEEHHPRFMGDRAPTKQALSLFFHDSRKALELPTGLVGLLRKEDHPRRVGSHLGQVDPQFG